ncbi:MAG: T9SS type A sorting domain-containing protein [Hymenobacteraceae bacterium]|nr:T9SS type A sorting domain-containing protein [Hymenobacteraceae bacterium]
MFRLLRFILLAALAGALPARAQLTLTLTSVPANTPAGAVITVAGTFNNWNPAAAGYQLTAQPGGQYTLTLPTSVRGAAAYKFTRGSWPTVETTTTGTAVPNRITTIPSTGATTVIGSIAGWEDLLAPTPTSTASPSVSILSTTFAMPQLSRTRRIWLYLPPDYATSQKTYPVLYMHDGQNLFDAATSFSGEWGVDETLDRLQTQGDWGCIVVGIDNGGTTRLAEYSPYPHPTYGGGQGDLYVDFLTNTLKPYIDANYRTRPDRLSTGVMGSSMGGLISLYAALKRPDVFGRAGVFSPSLWFNRRIYSYAKAAQPVRPNPRFYLLSGGRESATQVRDQRQLVDTLAAAGFQIGAEVDSLIKADGQHAEWFWKREFAAAYQWFFAGTGPLGSPDAYAMPAFTLYPNPGDSANGELHVEFIDRREVESGVSVGVLDATGRVVRTARLRRGKATVDVRTLPAGLYEVRVPAHRGVASPRWLKQ